MLKNWLIVVAVLGGIAATAFFNLPGSQQRVGQTDMAPVFSLPDLNGKMHELPRGEVILLNFWATWCPPCRREMPSMAALHRKLKGRGLKVIAVSVDRDRNALTGFVREYDLPFLVLHDADSRVARSYGVFRYPESFLIDRSGKVRQHHIGAVEWMSPQMVSGVETMLAEPAQE